MLNNVLSFFKVGHIHTYYRQREGRCTTNGTQYAERVICKGCGHVLDRSEWHINGQPENSILNRDNISFTESKLFDFEVHELIKYKNVKESRVN